MNKKLITINAIIIFLTSLLLISCGDSKGNENETVEEESGVYVETIELNYEEFTDYISLMGAAKALHKADLAAEEGGKIKEILKDKGNYVKAGEIIFTIENEVLKATLDGAKAQYDMAQANFERQEKVYNEKVTSEQQYLNSKYERDAAKANYELTKSRYEKSFIKAPFNGVVDKKYYEVGEIAAPGSPVVTLVSIDKIKVEAGVPENYVNTVKVGNTAKIIFPDIDSAEYTEKVSFVGNTISTTNRTFPVEILINNSNRKIKPELSARVNIIKESFEKAIVIPEEVMTKTDLGYAVFIEENGIAKMKIVDIISRKNNKAAIEKGLQEGDKLITIGYQNLIDGEKVKVLN